MLTLICINTPFFFFVFYRNDFICLWWPIPSNHRSIRIILVFFRFGITSIYDTKRKSPFNQWHFHHNRYLCLTIFNWSFNQDKQTPSVVYWLLHYYPLQSKPQISVNCLKALSMHSFSSTCRSPALLFTVAPRSSAYNPLGTVSRDHHILQRFRLPL